MSLGYEPSLEPLHMVLTLPGTSTAPWRDEDGAGWESERERERESEQAPLALGPRTTLPGTATPGVSYPPWEWYQESRRCSRDTYPELYIAKHASWYLPCPLAGRGLGRRGRREGEREGERSRERERGRERKRQQAPLVLGPQTPLPGTATPGVLLHLLRIATWRRASIFREIRNKSAAFQQGMWPAELSVRLFFFFVTLKP